MLRKAIVLALAGLLPLPLFAQSSDSVTVSVVEVPVTVVDKQGNPVRGLSTANFEVWDEGKKRMISGFEAIDFGDAQPAPQTAIAPLNPAARRNYMLLFDLSYSFPGALARAQEAAREFIEKSLNRRDRIAVATFDVNRGFRLLTAFTTDRNLARAAVKDPLEFRGTDPLQITSTGPTIIAEPVGIIAAAQSELGQRRQDAQQRFTEMQREWARRSADYDDQHRTQQVNRQIEILSSISRSLNTVTGRKEIILFSEGFDPKHVAGRPGNTKESQDDREAIQKGQIWRVNLEQTVGNSGSLALLQQFREMCRRTGVVLHAIDIKGIRGSADVRAGGATGSGTVVSNEGLHLIAGAGGGDVFKNSNDLKESLDRLIHQQDVIYVLAFRAPTTSPGSFHNLRVKGVGLPPGARVSHRAGYYEAGAENDAERTLATAEIMINDVAQSDVRVDALPSIFTRAEGNAAVPVIVDIDGSDLLRHKDDSILIAEVFVYAFDELGSVRDSLFQRLTIDTDRVASKLEAGGVKYLGTLSLGPGKYAIKTLVRLPEVSRNGFVRRDIEVPESRTISLSPPLFFEDASRWVLVKGTSHDPGPYPFVVGDDHFVPSAAPRVRDGERRRFAVFVANAGNETSLDVTPSASFVGRSGDAFIFDFARTEKSPHMNVALKGSVLRQSLPLD